jgi:hypothetical protein
MTSRPPSNQDQYSLEAPPLDQRNAQVISEQVQSQLAASGWQGREGGPGMALAQLFGRMAELIIARLNRAPEKRFLAFLNEAGIDLLAPRPASAELTFTLPDDYQGLVRVPAGTQVATVQTETQPEVIFETQQDINVVPTSLIKCVAFDQVNYSDYTAQARGEAPVPLPLSRASKSENASFTWAMTNCWLFLTRPAARLLLSPCTSSLLRQTTQPPMGGGWTGSTGMGLTGRGWKMLGPPSPTTPVTSARMGKWS